MRLPLLCILSAGLLVASNHAAETADGKQETPKQPVAPEIGERAKPVSPAEVDAAIERGIAFLVKRQNPSGSWGDPTRTKDLNIFAPVPGAHDAFRSGTSSLALLSLIESGAWKTNAQVRAAVDKGEDWMLKYLPKVRRADTVAIYNVWGHSYGLKALVAAHNRQGQSAERKEQIKEAIRGQIKLLQEYESVQGGWGYYDFDIGAKQPASDTASFTTATGLLALHDAKKIGIEIPERIVKRATDSLKKQQKPDHSYLYGLYLWKNPMHPVNRPAGSLGRSQACNLALRRWGDKAITDDIMTEWLQKLIDRNGWLSMGRKRPVPHESWFAVAGYFYYYGHYYAALCIEELGPGGVKFKQDIASIIVPLQETDGSWFDYPLYDYGHSYATGYALMTLLRCRDFEKATALAP
ncbi:MAG TPA: hypothetical protein VEH27_11200 [Methylomirabilota bacterium]|nr:hypothetical protein [Methylomirabilota bacterium]